MANDSRRSILPGEMEDDRARDPHLSPIRAVLGPACGPGLRWSRPPLTVLISPFSLDRAASVIAFGVAGNGRRMQRRVWHGRKMVDGKEDVV